MAGLAERIRIVTDLFEVGPDAFVYLNLSHTTSNWFLSNSPSISGNSNVEFFLQTKAWTIQNVHIRFYHPWLDAIMNSRGIQKLISTLWLKISCNLLLYSRVLGEFDECDVKAKILHTCDCEFAAAEWW